MEIIIYAFSIIIYSIRTLAFLVGSSLERSRTKAIRNRIELPFVTVVVPCRNEELNVERCFLSISQVDYPVSSYEIIAVNDRSGDNTLAKLNELAEQIPNLKIINITDESQKGNLKGKPGALHKGISAAKGSIIFMTDADCAVNSKWLKSIVNRHNDAKTGITPSYTLIEYNSLFEKAQAIEWIFMHTMAAAGVGLRQPLGCYGNNLIVKKDDYFNVGGYNTINFSVTEDLALLKAVFHSGRGVKYICDYDSTVTTLPCSNLKEYISQHRRWAIGGIDLGWRAAGFVISSVAVWIGLLTALFYSNIAWFLIILITRIISDSLLVLVPIIKLRASRLLPYVPPSVLFFLIIELIIPFLIINKKVEWKGQIFERKK